MKRLLNITMMAVCCSLLLTACSSEEESTEAISLKFQLCAIDGNATKVFKNGDNVVFDLAISNNSNSDITYGMEGADIIFGNDLYCVYSDDGRLIGVPWTGMYCEYIGKRYFFIPAKTVKHVYCTWNMSEDFRSSHPLCKGEDKDKLPVGSYYTKFWVEYNDNVGGSKKRMVTKNFKVGFKVQ